MSRLSRLNLWPKSAGFWSVIVALGSAALFGLLYRSRSNFSGAEWSIGGHTLHWENGIFFLALALIPSLLVGVGFSLSGLSLAQRLLSLVLRALFFVCLILSMAQPLRYVPSSKICQVALLDVSKSVSDQDLKRALGQLKHLAAELKPTDTLQLLTFAETPSRFNLRYDGESNVLLPSSLELRKAHLGESTNLQKALDFALAYTGTDCHNRYFVASDGIETRGDALSSVAQLVDRKVQIVSLPLDQANAHDVAVVRVDKEGEVRLGEPFKLRVELSATKPGQGQLRLYQNDIINGLDGVRQVELKEGKSAFTFESVVRVGGTVSYRAEYAATSSDLYAMNNEFVTSFDVPGPIKVLVVDSRPAQISYFVSALAAQQLDVDVRDPLAFPRSEAEINQFDFVVLSDIARKDFSRGAESLVEHYVRSGGGLLFAGGESGYGPGGWQGSNLAKILPVTMDAHKEREVPGVAMSLVIDRSGSMNGLPLAMAKEACIATLGILQQTDLIEVIAFDSRPTSYVPLQPARYRSRIEEAVARIQPGGGTEIFSSLDRAYQSLAAVEARRKHIILLTDGNAASDGIYELVATAFSEGITITSVGLGGGTNRALLSMIAETGGGRLIEAEEPSRLPRIFTRETELISSKPTLDEWFPLTVVRDADFLSGIGVASAPFLRGYTKTELAAPPAEAILNNDHGEPILARRPVGLGYSLAWTSDLKARWATDLLRWKKFGQMMAQLIRQHQKSDDTEIRPMQVTLRGDEVIAQVEAFDVDENFDNSLKSTLKVSRQASSAATSSAAPGSETASSHDLPELPFLAIAPGLYEARFRLPAPGAYSLRAQHHRLTAGGKLVKAGVSFGSVSLPYPEEYRDLAPRVEHLRQLAELTSGGLATAEALPQLQPAEAVQIREGRQQYFILAAIFLFFLDLLVRRVRLFDRNFSRSSGRIT